jgi:hypothetical protein
MGVDEAGKQDDIAEVENFIVGVGLKVRPRTDGADFISRDNHDAVFNRRL